MKPETRFRRNKVAPFLALLRHTAVFPIQQMAIRGDPDYLLCAHGRFVGLELKDVGEIPRPLQQEKLMNIERAKGVALVADESNWEWVKTVLLKLDQGEMNA